MEAITYSLTKGESNSDGYYRQVSLFTDKVLQQSIPFNPLIEEFKAWLQHNRVEEPRENEEYILELLSFGILWQTYGHIALSVKYAPFTFMSHLAEWRKKHQKLKPYIDSLRGALVSIFLFPRAVSSQQSAFSIQQSDTYPENNLNNLNNSTLSFRRGQGEVTSLRRGQGEVIPAPPPTLSQLNHVYKWFMATGEFREQALRFINWRRYWQQKTAAEIAAIFSDIEAFTFWFKENAVAELGSYTANVNAFLQQNGDKYRWREDRVQCMRGEFEYHLNMVGAELMNRALRSGFRKTLNKAVLMPGCMRKLPLTGCKAVKVPGGLKCTGCEDDCHVNKIRQKGLKDNFTVYVIPHASDLTQWSPSKQQRSLGVVASACLTTLVEGGWELKRYEVPAQCVVLDFCGCKKHWHPDGIETELNLAELDRILH